MGKPVAGTLRIGLDTIDVMVTHDEDLPGCGQLTAAPGAIRHGPCNGILIISGEPDRWVSIQVAISAPDENERTTAKFWGP